ncbi:hypothetical protein [Anatilimnocola floriformis]|uniref:hypothetical protein n=1 Tax=Anatilimnocola floriformis TaxID=2948575 RepID=UPI0020C4D0BA|nr:hypothetical protein [Anatilimnocola floriformis]
MTIPDHNNVYGALKTTAGLQSVLNALRSLSGIEKAFIYTSSHNGAETLHFSSAEFDFVSTPLEIHEHLLNGAVAGPPAQIAGTVQTIAAALTVAGIEAKFEINDENQNPVELVPAQTQIKK